MVGVFVAFIRVVYGRMILHVSALLLIVIPTVRACELMQYNGI